MGPGILFIQFEGLRSRCGSGEGGIRMSLGSLRGGKHAAGGRGKETLAGSGIASRNVTRNRKLALSLPVLRRPSYVAPSCPSGQGGQG